MDSAARQNKLFKSFNEEVQSTDASVQTHLERQWLTSYRCAGRCACLCVFVGVGECVTRLTHTAGFLKSNTDTDASGVKLPIGNFLPSLHHHDPEMLFSIVGRTNKYTTVIDKLFVV